MTHHHQQNTPPVAKATVQHPANTSKAPTNTQNPSNRTYDRVELDGRKNRTEEIEPVGDERRRVTVPATLRQHHHRKTQIQKQKQSKTVVRRPPPHRSKQKQSKTDRKPPLTSPE
jgi:hypothetical protein